MDISGVENEVLKYLAAFVGTGLLWLIKRAITWVGLKLSAERQAALIGAVDKMLTFGVTKAEQVIAQKGWDHVDSKDAVIRVALQALPEKFPDAVAGAGLDLKNPVDHAAVADMMERMIPDVFARAAASPATPPAPVAPIVVLPPATP
jgi:hypothetical protein